MVHVKSAEEISGELRDAMRRHLHEHRRLTARIAAGGDPAAEAVVALISETGAFAADLAALFGDALDTMGLLAQLAGHGHLDDGPGYQVKD